ncbi:hypothetical protein NFI96_007257 [Prochilodus magdalenae]|nr:hypothetical protein NFI96_007257 [Prochilodus magdalenae]
MERERDEKCRKSKRKKRGVCNRICNRNRISACLTDISSWMTAHHLKLNPSKTELLFIPSTTGPHCDLTISFGNSLITPTEDARSLGVILDGQLSFSAHIANLTRSCRFLLYNIRRIRPFLSQEATQLLVQSLVISRLDYCNSLLAGLPLRAIRPLQLVQNAAARLIFNLPKFTHVTPLLRSLHWLPVVARIRFKTLMLAYKAKNGPAPPYLMAMVKSRAVPRALRASSTARLEPPSLRTHGRQVSRLFSVLAPRWWNELPLGVRTAESLAVFKRRLKTHLFVKHLSEYQHWPPVRAVSELVYIKPENFLDLTMGIRSECVSICVCVLDQPAGKKPVKGNEVSCHMSFSSWIRPLPAKEPTPHLGDWGSNPSLGDYAVLHQLLAPGMPTYPVEKQGG